MNELGELLRELRGKKALRDISKITGLSHTYISDLEKGFKHGTKAPINPSFDTLKRLSKAYNYDYDKLLKAAGYIDHDSVLKEGGEKYKASEELMLTPDDLKILEEIKKHPVLFHDLANAPEKKIKQLIKMWEFIKKDLENEDDRDDIIDD
jgi:transcriptional regulator with XRE-family HTH domain